MAIDQTPPPSSSDTMTKPAIENEFPAYRAISSLAVFSLILGLASVFCFADNWFLLLVGGSTVTGILALRKIARYPDILTGASYARVGIGVGLLFGISAITHEVLQDVLTSIDARRFANYYIEVIKDKPISQALWYQQSLDLRKTKTPDEVVDIIKKTKNPTTSDPYGQKTEPYLKIKDRLKVAGQTLHYSKIETKVVVGLAVYANVLLELDGPATKEYPHQDYALLQLTKAPGVGNYDWVILDFQYPYVPSSAKVEVPHGSDDGHGH